MANTDIRTTARENRVTLWQIADHIGVSEATMTRMLRKELPAASKQRVLLAIENIASENTVDQQAV